MTKGRGALHDHLLSHGMGSARSKLPSGVFTAALAVGALATCLSDFHLSPVISAPDLRGAISFFGFYFIAEVRRKLLLSLAMW